MLSQWKLFDNLRRSLVPAALDIAAAAGMDRAVAGVALDRGRGRHPADAVHHRGALRSGGQAGRRARSDNIWPPSRCAARRHVVQALLALAFLPYEAFFCLDAIMRTVGRMLFTHRRLLEWNPSSDVDRALEQRDRTGPARILSLDGDRPGHRRRCVDWTCLSLIPLALPVAGPILLLWGASPAIAWWISRPLARRSARLTVDQTHFLRKLARKTWAYFETLRRPGRPLAAARQRAGTVRRSASRIGPRRPTWDWRCLPI